MSTARAIDWDTAQRIGELIAGSPPYGGPAGRSVQPLAHEFAGRVSEYTGLNLPTELPPLEMIDRPAWIAANLHTMRPLLDPLLEQLGGERTARYPAAALGLRPSARRAAGRGDGHALPAGARPVRPLSARRLRAAAPAAARAKPGRSPRATSVWIATS